MNLTTGCANEKIYSKTLTNKLKEIFGSDVIKKAYIIDEYGLFLNLKSVHYSEIEIEMCNGNVVSMDSSECAGIYRIGANNER